MEDCDLCDLAAAYLFHLAENQPFVDGNRRAALASSLVFLHQNGDFPAFGWLGFEYERVTDAYREAGWPPWTAYVLISIAPGVFEEWAFRGYVMARLDRLLTPHTKRWSCRPRCSRCYASAL